jgi:hypothetical protein
MRSRPLAAVLLALAFPVAACQLIWSYDGFKDQPGTGGGSSSSSTGSSTSESSTSAGSTSESSASGSACFAGDAGCPNGAPTGMACTGCCDQMLIAADPCALQGDVYNCTLQHLNDQNGAQACIAKAFGYSTACAGCLAGVGQCGYTKCWPSCVNMVNSPGCNACLAAHCDSDFVMCSGIPRPEAIDGGVDGSCK